MKHRLIDLLACPACGGFPLRVAAFEMSTGPETPVSSPRCERYCGYQSLAVEGGSAEWPCSRCYALEITSGKLTCSHCGADYPIVRDIPRFNPDAARDFPEFFRVWENQFRRSTPADDTSFENLHAATKSSFGFQWLRFEVTGLEENRAHFYRRTGTTPGTLARQLFFEAGCGMGRYLSVIGEEPGAEVVGLDLSLAVDRARAENRDKPGVHVIQGNLLQLPLRLASFTHVYSIGVLHHTRDTRQAFRSILRLARPGGRVSIWVYHVWRPPELQGLKAVEASIRAAVSDGLRRVTTRLPHGALRCFCYLAAPLGQIQRWIVRLPQPLRALLSPLYWLPVSTHVDWRVRITDTFDWYAPQYQWKHTVEEVEGWFREAGLVDISTQGFPVSVRGTVARAPTRAEPNQRA